MKRGDLVDDGLALAGGAAGFGEAHVGGGRVNRSSTSSTGKPKRPLSSRANCARAAIISCSVPSRWRRQAHDQQRRAAIPAISAAIAAKRRLFVGGFDGRQRMGDAAPTCRPRPTPMRCFAEIECQDGGAVHQPVVARAAHPPAGRRLRLTHDRIVPTESRSRRRAVPWRAAGAPRAAGRKSRRSRASTVSHAFCASSCSSWPGAQPA